MCGIAGVIGRDSPTLILDILRKLEYRGYDSVGVASIHRSKLDITKGVGTVNDVFKGVILRGGCFIGHTRWATHGKVTEANAHPHLDCSYELAVVHNGIIENYGELKTELKSHRFVSETDSEVIPHLIEREMAKGLNFTEATKSALGLLKGAFAVLVMCLDCPDTIICAKKDSPLIVGYGNGCIYAASDIVCMTGKAEKVFALADGEMAVLHPSGITVSNFTNGKTLTKPFIPLDEKWDSALGKQPHYMLKEIYEGAAAVKLDYDKAKIQDFAIEILRSRQCVFAASGTSRYASIIGRYLFSRLAGKLGEVVMGSELHYFSDSIDRNTLILAVSQSGETADVLHGVKIAKQNGARVVSIVNMPNSSLESISDKTLRLNCGPEIAVAATKSFIAQLACFYAISYAMANNLDYWFSRSGDISKLISETLDSNAAGIKRIALETKEQRDFYFLGRAIHFALAGESALKVKEVSYVHAEGMPAGELKHGTLALIEKGTPVISICPKDYTYDESISNAHETKARGAYLIGVSDAENGIFDAQIKLPPCEDVFYPLIASAPLQLLAYEAAVIRGKNPDRPRNLAKSVTVC